MFGLWWECSPSGFSVRKEQHDCGGFEIKQTGIEISGGGSLSFFLFSGLLSGFCLFVPRHEW